MKGRESKQTICHNLLHSFIQSVETWCKY